MKSFGLSLLKFFPICIASVCVGAPNITKILLPANDIVYDPFSDRILASVPSRAGATRGNTITLVDPHTGQLGASVFVASEPSKLALADDGSRVYVASDATNSVTPFSLLSMTPGAPFPVGDVGHRVEDMDVAPGNAAALAVSLRRMGGIPRGVGVSIFLDGAKLPKSISSQNNAVEFGDAPNILYGYNNESTSRDFRSNLIDLSPTGGISEGFNADRIVTQTGLDMEFDNGRMYFTNGQVIDVSPVVTAGTFIVARGPVEPESEAGRVYFIVENKLTAFDQTTFAPLGEMTIPEFTGAAKNLISLGGSALALTTTTDQVFIIRLPGDYDANGVVSAADYDIWKANYGSTTNLVADANQDNIVDAADYVVWRKNLGQTLVGTEGGVSSSNVAAPEPAPLLTLVLGAAASLRMRRRG